MMRLTWWRGPWSMLSYQPQGRCTLRCRTCSPRCSRPSWATIFFTSWLFSRLATSTASARLDHDHVVQPDHADQAAGGMHQRVAAVADDGVADGWRCRARPSRPPATRPPRRRGRSSRRPAAPCGCRARPGTSPSPRSRPIRRARPRTRPCPGARSLASVLRTAQAARQAAAMSGRKRSQRRQPHRRLQHEHAGVPEVAAAARYCSAVARSGFSTNCATAAAPPSARM